MLPYKENQRITKVHLQRLLVTAYELYYHEGLKKRLICYRFAARLTELLASVPFEAISRIELNQHGPTLYFNRPLDVLDAKDVWHAQLDWSIDEGIYVVAAERLTQLFLRLTDMIDDHDVPGLQSEIDAGMTIDALCLGWSEDQVNVTQYCTWPRPGVRICWDDTDRHQAT